MQPPPTQPSIRLGVQWPREEIAAALAEGLREQERDLLAEQAVHGLDALDEVELHPLLAAGIRAGGLGAFPEIPYPTDADASRKMSERERCDLVLTPAGATGIADSLRTRKDVRQAQDTLFAPLAAQLAAPAPGLTDPAEAFWLEVKTVGQFAYVDGVAGPNRMYASQFNTCLADVRKLARATALRHTALAIVLFASTAEVAEHDLGAFAHKCLDHDLPLAGLVTERVEIADRIGNTVCVLGLVPLRPTMGG